MKKLALFGLMVLATQADARSAASNEMTTVLKIKAWGGSAPSWNVTGNRGCIHNIVYHPSSEAKWANIGTASEAPRYNFEVKHKPRCNAVITFHWDGSPNDSDNRPDSFARVEMKQYY